MPTSTSCTTPVRYGGQILAAMSRWWKVWPSTSAPLISPRQRFMIETTRMYRLWWNGRLHGIQHVKRPESTGRHLMRVLATIASVARMMRATSVSVQMDMKATLTSSMDAKVYLSSCRPLYYFLISFFCSCWGSFEVPPLTSKEEVR
jgi:hypothetical protein